MEEQTDSEIRKLGSRDCRRRHYIRFNAHPRSLRDRTRSFLLYNGSTPFHWIIYRSLEGAIPPDSEKDLLKKL